MKENNSEKLKLLHPKSILIEDLGMMFSTEKSKRKYKFGIYKCGLCGEEFRTQINNVKNGNTKSCGCYGKRRLSETHKTHGKRHTRIYRIWGNLKNRILNNNTKVFKDYGGRGITVCDEWKNDFKSFYDWSILNGYEDELSIDRIDNDGNYCPENCRWTTKTIQARNTRIPKNNSSGYKGVYFNKRRGKYQAHIVVNKKSIYLGSFPTPVEAGIAYNNYIIENNLEGYILNEIPLVNLIK